MGVYLSHKYWNIILNSLIIFVHTFLDQWIIVGLSSFLYLLGEFSQNIDMLCGQIVKLSVCLVWRHLTNQSSSFQIILQKLCGVII